jgi:peptidoglycan/LPS O-acetylase OafA/YrhL
MPATFADPQPSVHPSRPKEAAVYQPQFDSLRALAVLTVMGDHFAAEIPNFPVPDWVHLGPIGVRLFLVLSGYFITASLRRTRDRLDSGEGTSQGALREFYRRRFLRILPPYALFLFAGLLLNIQTMRQNALWIATFSVNFLIAWTGQWPLAISHLWSVCVQEQFYLVWPGLVLFLPRRWVLRAIVGAAAAGVLFRVGCVVFSVPLVARWVLPFGSLDALACGAALAWAGWKPDARSVHRPWTVVAGGAACALALTVAGILRNGDQARMASVLVEPLEVLAMTWLVAQTLAGWGGWVGWILSSRALIAVGRMSYGIYIYHVMIIICLDRWVPAPWRWSVEIPAVRLVTLTAATLLIAGISWHWIEQPINRLRHGLRHQALA